MRDYLFSAKELLSALDNIQNIEFSTQGQINTVVIHSNRFPGGQRKFTFAEIRQAFKSDRIEGASENKDQLALIKEYGIRRKALTERWRTHGRVVPATSRFDHKSQNINDIPLAQQFLHMSVPVITPNYTESEVRAAVVAFYENQQEYPSSMSGPVQFPPFNQHKTENREIKWSDISRWMNEGKIQGVPKGTIFINYLRSRIRDFPIAQIKNLD